MTTDETIAAAFARLEAHELDKSYERFGYAAINLGEIADTVAVVLGEKPDRVRYLVSATLTCQGAG